MLSRRTDLYLEQTLPKRERRIGMSSYLCVGSADKLTFELGEKLRDIGNRYIFPIMDS